MDANALSSDPDARVASAGAARAAANDIALFRVRSIGRTLNMLKVEADDEKRSGIPKGVIHIRSPQVVPAQTATPLNTVQHSPLLPTCSHPRHSTQAAIRHHLPVDRRPSGARHGRVYDAVPREPAAAHTLDRALSAADSGMQQLGGTTESSYACASTQRINIGACTSSRRSVWYSDKGWPALN